jgi:ferredoxin
MVTSTVSYRGPPKISMDRCDGCGACATLCPTKALRVLDKNNIRRIEFSPAYCIFCGRCSEICPENAIKLTSRSAVPTRKVLTTKQAEFDLVRCEICDRVVAPTKVICKIERMEKPSKILDDLLSLSKTYCDQCKRLMIAKKFDFLIYG